MDTNVEVCDPKGDRAEGGNRPVYATKEHYQKATCLQHLTFSWATKLILRAFSNEIDADELWDLPPEFSAEKATERLREKCKSILYVNIYTSCSILSFCITF